MNDPHARMKTMTRERYNALNLDLTKGQWDDYLSHCRARVMDRPGNDVVDDLLHAAKMAELVLDMRRRAEELRAAEERSGGPVAYHRRRLDAELWITEMHAADLRRQLASMNDDSDPDDTALDDDEPDAPLIVEP